MRYKLFNTMNKKGLPYKDFSDICGEVFLQEVLKDTSSIGYFKTKIDQKETWIKICDAFGLDGKFKFISTVISNEFFFQFYFKFCAIINKNFTFTY